MPHGLPPRDWPGGARSPVPSSSARRFRWVAQPPPGVADAAPEPPAPPYTGPPSYPAPPRWGFPNLGWRRPTMVPGTPSAAQDPVHRQRPVGIRVVSVLAGTAMLAGMAGAAELWRYGLLVVSRSAALSTTVVRASDALVVATSILAFLAGIGAVGLTFWWFLLARAAAVRQLGVRPPRHGWRLAVAFFAPGVNLVLAGSALAEFEHLLLGKPADRRPVPSRWVQVWWAAWAANGVLVAVTVGWRLRDGIQAEADSVLLAACTDLVAATLAALTAVLVARWSALLSPASPGARRMRVLHVRDAPAPPLRRARPAGSAR